ncbi:IclR family transcriptional regulator [Nocardioides sp. BYT-33-1]|uniref:IclR family transcriptional regulator n=1 Tax=Nocardioides sp. BYT-33-1 TaxID=3416952 RepID=UPI003F52CBDE
MSTSRMDPESISAPSQASGAAKNLVKGLALIDLVATADRPLRLVDLVEATGLPRPTALRLLEVLCRGEVLRSQSDGSYALGPRVAGWGQAFLESIDLPGAAEDLVQELVSISGETCYVGVLDDRSVLYIAAVHGPHAIRPAARVGSRMPLYSTGIGKVLLSARSREEREGLLPEVLTARTENTITDRSRLHAHLDEVRDTGYAIDEIENEEGVRCVAAPIHDHTGAVTAALSVSAPAYRFSREDVTRLSADVLRITGEISARLGHHGSRGTTTREGEGR